MEAAPLPATFRRWAAATFGGPGALKLSELPLEPPGSGELLLRVLATDATYTDLLILAGNYPNPRCNKLPITPGYDCAAVVAAVGAGVVGFALGDAVLCMPLCGCASEYVCMAPKDVVKIDDAAGAAFVKGSPCVATSLALTGTTAFQMLHRVMGKERLARPQAAILVHGAAGGTGAMVVQLAKLAGLTPARIVGTCSRKNLEAVRALGVTAVCYEDADWAVQARAATEQKRGFEAVLDGAASLAYYSAGVALLCSRGIYVAYGFTDNASPGAIALSVAVPVLAMASFRHHLLSGVGFGDALFYNVADRRDLLPTEFAADLRELVALAASGKLEVVVGREWRFFQVADALCSIAKNEHRGKQCIYVTAEPPAE